MSKISEFLKGFVLWFAIFYASFLAVDYFFGGDKEVQKSGSVVLRAVDDTPVLGHMAQWKLKNNTPDTWTLPSACTTPGALTVRRLFNNKAEPISDFSNCDGYKVPAFTLNPGKSTMLTLRDWNQSLFGEAGTYDLVLNLQKEGAEEPLKVTSDRMEFSEPGLFRQLFRALVTKPLFNLLVFISGKLPNHSLGWSIIILTLVVRLLLFFPNQKAMRSQRELQKLQPQLEELKKKHGKNQQMMAMETMRLYKAHRVNPMSSCLPMLAQLPFLLGVYYVVRGGVSTHMEYLLYQSNTSANLGAINPHFFTLNLEQIPNFFPAFALPLVVAGAQFVALRLSLGRAANKNKPTEVTKKDDAPDMAGQMQSVQKTMVWILPLMIGFFTLTFPAGIGIYWLTSTVLGIAQQQLVAWQLDRPQVRRKES